MGGSCCFRGDTQRNTNVVIAHIFHIPEPHYLGIVEREAFKSFTSDIRYKNAHHGHVGFTFQKLSTQ